MWKRLGEPGRFFNPLCLYRPIKAGIFPVLLISFSTPSLFNPLALWALPLYRCAAQGERDMHHSVLVIEGIGPSPLPCPVALREVALAIGETPQKW